MKNKSWLVYVVIFLALGILVSPVVYLKYKYNKQANTFKGYKQNIEIIAQAETDNISKDGYLTSIEKNKIKKEVLNYTNNVVDVNVSGSNAKVDKGQKISIDIDYYITTFHNAKSNEDHVYINTIAQ